MCCLHHAIPYFVASTHQGLFNIYWPRIQRGAAAPAWQAHGPGVQSPAHRHTTTYIHTHIYLHTFSHYPLVASSTESSQSFVLPIFLR